MKKKLLATLLVATMAISMLAGCGGQPASSGDTLTIEIYDAAANYQGMQTGWFAKVVKDKFNLELNIIAPQVAGEAVYQTRASEGNLGDIVLLDAVQFKECVAAGLIRDISDKIGDCKNLMDYKTQIDVFNNGLPDNSGKTYGIPTEMTNTSPTSKSEDVIYSSPLVRWDLYKEIGSPDIQDLDGLLDALEAMQKAHPTNDAGDSCYPFSLWADWDNNDNMMGPANVVQLTTWYGEKVKDSVILKPDGTFTDLTDKNSAFYKIVKFINNAYRRGLVDPDSGTQDWNAACAKMSAGQVYLMWYSWQVGFWNSQDRLNDGSAFIFVPVKDQYYYADSDTYYGSGRIFGVGSQVEGEKYERVMEFLDWYASPEGLVYQHSGIEGFNYSVGEDGKFTVMNDNALMDNLPVPEEYGGAGYQDGNNAINQWIVSAISTNPNTGETYSTQYWSSYKAATQTEMKKEWAAKFGAAEPVEYMKNNNVLFVSPSVSVSLEPDTNDINVLRNTCKDIVCKACWQMFFATDDASFDSLWDKMVSDLKGNDYETLTAFDKAKWQVEVDAKNAALK